MGEPTEGEKYKNCCTEKGVQPRTSTKFQNPSSWHPLSSSTSVNSDSMSPSVDVTVGVLALQGAFNEHVQLLRQAAQILALRDIITRRWAFKEIRTAAELATCDALIIPGGESTTMSLVAERSKILEPLRDFVK
jgi:hypothetical protein